MFLVKWALAGLLILPAAEILVFLLVAASIGWLRAGILLVAPSIMGVLLLKRSGSRELARLARALRTDGVLALHLDSPGVAGMVATLLLIIPGFLTDVLGGILLVPALRRWAIRALATAWRRKSDHKQKQQSRFDVIDLQPGEWHQIPEQRRTAQAKPNERKFGEPKASEGKASEDKTMARNPSRRPARSRQKKSGT